MRFDFEKGGTTATSYASTDAAEAYQLVYIDNTVPWKTKENKFKTITIEEVCEIQEKALDKIQQIWTKWG